MATSICQAVVFSAAMLVVVGGSPAGNCVSYLRGRGGEAWAIKLGGAEAGLTSAPPRTVAVYAEQRKRL